MSRSVARLALALASLLPGALSGQIPQSEYAARRDSLLAQVPEGVLLVLGTPAPAADYLTFFPAPHFEYLTGFREPNAALVLAKRDGRTTGMLFVQPRDPKREVWTGRRAGTDGAARLTGLVGREEAELRPVLDSLLRVMPELYVVGDLAMRPALSADAQFVAALEEAHPGLEVHDLGPAVRALRARKSAAELALIRRAAEITMLALGEAIRAIEPEMHEYEIQALIEYMFRRHGADRPSFATIVGSGPNATTLHHNTNDRVMAAGDVVVMDVGASFRGYAADVTRTVPVSGSFTPAQREIYRLVRDAQAAAERQATVGAPARLMDDSASAVLAAGLTRLGLIESPTATFDAAPGACARPAAGGCQQLSLYYMHALGHGIGLEVHDPDISSYPGTIQQGSAFTLEPGIYVRSTLLEELPDTPRNRQLAAKIRGAVERYGGIGVRIEDDYIVTERGVEWISPVPREIGEIEQLMREESGRTSGLGSQGRTGATRRAKPAASRH